MIKEYAIEKIEENKNTKSVYVNWASEKTGSDRYIAMFLCRSFNLRNQRDILIVNKIFKAYDLEFNFTGQSKKATLLFNNHNTSCNLDFITVKTLKVLADKVDKMGLDPLLSVLL